MTKSTGSNRFSANDYLNEQKTADFEAGFKYQGFLHA